MRLPHLPSSLYCAADHRRRNQARYGRVPLNERQQGMETLAAHSFATAEGAVMAEVPKVVPCPECGENLAEGVSVVHYGGTTTIHYVRAYWGTMEKHDESASGEIARTTVECPWCEKEVPKAVAKVLRLPEKTG